MVKNLGYVTSLDGKATREVILWEILHSVFVAAPSGILMVIIWELFSEEPNVNKVWAVVGLMALMLIGQFFVASKSMVKSNMLTYKLSAQLRMGLGNRVRKFSLGFFKRRDPGEIASVMLQDVANFESIFGHSIGNLASAVFGTATLSVFLLAYDWRLGLCLLFALPLAYPLLWVANFLVRKFGKRQIKARNAMAAKFLEYIQGIRHLKSYGLAGERYRILEDSFDDLRRQSIRLEALPGPFVVTAAVVFELGFLCMVALGLYYLSENSITIPVLVTFLILGYTLYGPLKIVMVDYLVLRYMNESLGRVVDVMSVPTMESGQAELPHTYDISFEHVTFGYGEKATLSNLNFSVPEKSMLALVGHSGSGKTTIASLIARFWDVEEGCIRIGGTDIRKIDYDKFYHLISEVFQDVYLFDDTIYNNIKVGKPDATEDEILDAAEKAQVLDFAWELPNGMNTTVGEGGNRLSGGQKQRISIARALLKDAPIVLLDEATASLDPENEVYIQRAIQELVKSKTVVVIAHKLATIRNAQQIVVLENGRIAEVGTHAQLFERQHIYHKLWNIQQRVGGWKVSAS